MRLIMKWTLAFLPSVLTTVFAFPSEASANITTNNETASRKIDYFPQITNFFPTFLVDKTKGRENSLIGNERNPIYDNAQKFVVNILRPQPIVDTISEHEKYGNTGDQFRSIGNVIIEKYENFSNFLNSAVDLPLEAMKNVTRRASSYINSLGAKFVGP